MSKAPDPLCSQKVWRKITLVKFKGKLRKIKGYSRGNSGKLRRILSKGNLRNGEIKRNFRGQEGSGAFDNQPSEETINVSYAESDLISLQSIYRESWKQKTSRTATRVSQVLRAQSAPGSVRQNVTCPENGGVQGSIPRSASGALGAPPRAPECLPSAAARLHALINYIWILRPFRICLHFYLVAPYCAILQYCRCDTPYRAILFKASYRSPKMVRYPP